MSVRIQTGKSQTLQWPNNMSDSKDEDTGYRPISCANHDVFEIAMLHRARLHLTWIEKNVLQDKIVTPLDIETANHEEFLIARSTTGQTFRLRLDWIREIRAL